MVVIRLSRGGSKKRPFYRMVISDSRMSRDGRFIEQVGTYDPRDSQKGISLHLGRINHWLQMGAQPSETARALINKSRVSGTDSNERALSS